MKSNTSLLFTNEKSETALNEYKKKEKKYMSSCEQHPCCLRLMSASLFSTAAGVVSIAFYISGDSLMSLFLRVNNEFTI